MSMDFTFGEQRPGYGYTSILLPTKQASTAQPTRLTVGSSVEAAGIGRRTREIAEELEEREWEAIVSKPRVKHELRRMAKEALRQLAAGETEEGGFGLE